MNHTDGWMVDGRAEGCGSGRWSGILVVVLLVVVINKLSEK